ncbi:MAG: symmetrical bis(5'-nucleosyl)-tetraphosphatase [Gallionella sp.]|nr:symmetrical bis(5'-nucleosyl)-tetraphosphatase [Gallionella sp.]MDD4945463.1 symmetrical bis(5'-nucleosyl)-tetraphosphatase [Gallionella sp.]
MAIYAVGDIQGCHVELVQLLEKLRFDPATDTLWLVGDLVNRGPGSLQVLRLVKSLGDSAITVLGNHDLHLLAVAEGVARLHRGDTLDEILAAPDRDELLDWLRHQRLLHAAEGHVLVHAGLLPGWTVEQAASLAGEVETALRGDDYVDFLAHMYGNKPTAWDDGLEGYKRLRVITNALTRMRICTADGEMEFDFKAEQHKIPAGYLPWFDVAGRASCETTVVFGHWSALGLMVKNNAIALDSGCLWGGPLTAIRLPDRAVIQVASGISSVAKHW